MKNRILGLIMIVMFAMGLCILLYPTLSDWYSRQNQTLKIEHYSNAVAQLEQSQVNEEWKRAQEYNERLVNPSFTDPFSSSLEENLTKDYLSALNIDGVMGYLEIPDISAYLPIYHGTSEATIRKGVGHLKESTLPIGGSGSHSVLTSHSGLSSTKLFTKLDELELEDRFYVHVMNKTFAYKIDQILVVNPSDTEALEPVLNEDYVTLVTCTPYAINSHRLLVRGTRTTLNADDETYIPRKETFEDAPWLPAIIIIPVSLITFFAVRSSVIKRGKKREGI